MIQKKNRYRVMCNRPLYRNYSNTNQCVALLEPDDKDHLYFDSKFIANAPKVDWTYYHNIAEKNGIDAKLYDIHGVEITQSYVGGVPKYVPIDIRKLMSVLLPNKKQFHDVTEWNKNLFNQLRKCNSDYYEHLGYCLSARIDHAIPIHNALYAYIVKAHDIRVVYYTFIVYLLYIYYIFIVYLLYIYYIFIVHLLYIYYIFNIYSADI